MVLLLEYFVQTKRALEKWKGRNKIPTCVRRRSSHSPVIKMIPDTSISVPHRTLCILHKSELQYIGPTWPPRTLTV
jgi:hypothetical protein